VDYSALAAKVSAILTKFGQTVTLRKYPLGVYDTATGAMGSRTAVDFSRKAAIFDFGMGQQNGPGGLIQGGDKSCLMQTGIVPALQDHVILADGTEYTVIGIASDAPGGIAVDYSLHLRT
jgi:hypothetical protein